MSIDTLDHLQTLLARPSEVTIITHRNPDGDAIGSSMAMKMFLERYGHVVQVIFPSEYPVIFDFVPSIETSIVYDQDRDRAIEAIDRAEIIFCLDFNGLDRIDTLGPFIDKSKAYKAMIDHHIDPEPFADYYMSDTSASSTCELVYRFISELGEKRKMDLDIATCLFVGLITDTGSFKYATSPGTFRVAADLKEMGVDDYTLQDHIFNAWTERQLNILGHALRNRMTIHPDLKTGVIYLNRADYQKYQIARGDTEGLVNYLLMIKGIEVAAFIRQMGNGEIRLSLRSKGDISVQELARKYFNGGGHKNASGGSSTTTLEETIERFVSVVHEFI